MYIELHSNLVSQYCMKDYKVWHLCIKLQYKSYGHIQLLRKGRKHSFEPTIFHSKVTHDSKLVLQVMYRHVQSSSILERIQKSLNNLKKKPHFILFWKFIKSHLPPWIMTHAIHYLLWKKFTSTATASVSCACTYLLKFLFINNVFIIQ